MEMDTKIFQYWYNDITKFIKNTIDNSSRVVIIALSRKMPRLITWALKEVLSESQVEYFLSLIHNPRCIYTTEHAIPFIFSQDDIKDTEVLILDDMIVTGETIQSVSDEICELIGRKPNYLSLYAYAKNQGKGVGFSTIGTNISEELPKQFNNIGVARNIMREFSKVIESTQLPIDMEFPILRINAENSYDDIFDQISNELRTKQPEARCYTHKSTEQKVDFTQLIEKDINRLFNNDFAKLRLFRSDREVRLVCYAPNILSDEQIMDATLFANEKYSLLWKNLLENNIISDPVKGRYDHIISEEDILRHKLSLRLHKSLIVFANYIFSLSMMIRQKPYYMEVLLNSKYKVELHKDDLALLIGPHLAGQYIDPLNKLFKDSITSDSLHKEIDLPELLATTNVISEYNFISTSAIFNASTIEEAINKIFAAAYRVCSDFKEHSDSSIKGEYIMESFQSLYNKPSILFQGPDAEKEINKIIDRLVDKGFIVPIYERVKNENNSFYWRRFFRATHTAPFLNSSESNNSVDM